MEMSNKKRPLINASHEERAKRPRTVDDEQLPCLHFSFDLVNNPNAESKIKEWLTQVDLLKSKFGWSDFQTIHKVLVKFESMSELYTWVSSISKIMTWKDCKKMLLRMFPGESDYHLKMKRMVNRKKKPDETYQEYFEAKLQLIRKTNVPDDELVSCLIGGVTNVAVACIARVGQYNTPEKLLDYFKWCEDKKPSVVAPAKDDKPKDKRAAATKTSSKSDSTKKKANKKKKKPGPKSKLLCVYCGELGHENEACPTKTSTIGEPPAPELQVQDANQAPRSSAVSVTEMKSAEPRQDEGERKVNAWTHKWKSNYRIPNAVELAGNPSSSGARMQELNDEGYFSRDVVLYRPPPDRNVCFICLRAGHEAKNCLTYSGVSFAN